MPKNDKKYKKRMYFFNGFAKHNIINFVEKGVKMSSCLGLYIEDNFIKYAKVSREKDLLRVEAFGIKFYDKIGDAIKQVIEETYSYKTPISINLSEEVYNYFSFFNLLNKKDLKKAIETEFEAYCTERNYNRNALETRYTLVQDLREKEKFRAIYVYANKAEITKRTQALQGSDVSTITSLPICISNIVNPKPNENALVVNIENKTTVTTIINQNVYEVKKIKYGAKDFLNKINSKENSYAKAYEICKNTTIYTMEGKDIIPDENLYLEDIMPVLYNIVLKVKEIAEKSINHIDKIYITGLGSVINNIDLYFQEYFTTARCEILKPYFAKENMKINIKDYIEVNSAIALAMQGLGYGVREFNFKKNANSSSISELMKMEIGGGKNKGKNSFKTSNISFDLRGKLDNAEKWLVRGIVAVAELLVVYLIVAIFLNIQISTKIEEIETVQKHNESQIANLESDLKKAKSKTTKYVTMKENLDNYRNNQTHSNEVKNTIPTLLNEIMSAIPKEGIAITAIENTSENKVSINVQSTRYDLLGYFISEIKNGKILNNVTSSEGPTVDGTIKIVIKGELP